MSNPKKKILIIEDNEELRENLEETLELCNYEVQVAADGQEGVKVALETLPDLILCDIMMPKLDGYGVLNILNKKAATADIPFIFLTAKSEKTDWRRGMNLGADDYITKPFYQDELLAVIEKRLEKSERLKSKFDQTAIGWNAFLNEAKGWEALQQLSVNHNTKTFKKKEFLFLEGDAPRYLYFVLSGKIKAIKTNDYGKEFITDIYEKGNFVGYNALLSNVNYSSGCCCLEDTVVSLIPKDEFLKLMYSNRDVAVQFIKILTGNMVEKEQQLLQLAYSSVRKRVANALLSLNKDKNSQTVHILRDDLAGLVGTARESVIRILSEFKQDGYIEINNGEIVILKPKKLRDVPA